MTDIFGSIVNIDDNEFNYLRTVIYDKTGISLADHKKIMLQSRLNIRLRANHINNFQEYVKKLKVDKNFFNTEIHEIINRITTNKTDFFRENHHFEFLRDTCFPVMEEKARVTGKRKVRIWSSACSTGEEPYTIAITLLEYFQNKFGWDVKIYASDIDTNVLATAQKGTYKEDKMSTVKSEYKTKYFTIREENGIKEYTAKPILKDLILFRKLNLLDDIYPFQEKFDIIFCRNVIIYFDKPTQKKIFSKMENLLIDEGLLIIGHSETLFGITESFKFMGHTIYKKKS